MALVVALSTFGSGLSAQAFPPHPFVQVTIPAPTVQVHVVHPAPRVYVRRSHGRWHAPGPALHQRHHRRHHRHHGRGR